jgi:hypothetical protein
LLWREFGGPGLAALETAPAAQGDSGRILAGVGVRGLPDGLLDDGGGEAVEVGWAFA